MDCDVTIADVCVSTALSLFPALWLRVDLSCPDIERLLDHHADDHHFRQIATQLSTSSNAYAPGMHVRSDPYNTPSEERIQMIQ